MANPQQLPHQLNKDPINGANQRATQNALMSQPRFVTMTLDSVYSEPMPLNVGAEQPESIELTRILNLSSQELPVLCGQMCHWVYRPDLGGAQLTSIDGLTPSALICRFTFRITYKAQV
jgi:hypothetical protein